jgi:hypothetical protein
MGDEGSMYFTARYVRVSQCASANRRNHFLVSCIVVVCSVCVCVWVLQCVGVCMFGCFGTTYVLVFTVFFYCFVYLYLFLFVLSVLV